MNDIENIRNNYMFDIIIKIHNYNIDNHYYDFDESNKNMRLIIILYLKS